MRAKFFAAVTTSVLAAFGGSPDMAATLYVATSGTDGTNCGASGSPCKTIGFAIGKTVAGDTLLVRAGTYAECIDVGPGTGSGGISVQTEAFSTSQTVGSAILDGKNVCDGGSGTTPGPVVIVGDKSSLSGFAVKHGGDSGVWGLGAVSIRNNLISGNATPSVGGGIYVLTGTYLTDSLSKAVIADNIVDSNTANWNGAGIHVYSLASGKASDVLISGNTVTNNTAGGVSQPWGGGISVFTQTSADPYPSTVTITTNTVSGNTVRGPTSNGAFGGGIFVATSGAGIESVTVGSKGSGNILRNNVSDDYGGGVSVNLQPFAGSRHSIIVEGNTITGNSGNKAGGGIHAKSGGPGYFDLTVDGFASLRVQDNTVTGNHARGALSDASAFGGGGLFAEAYSYRTPIGVSTFNVERNSFTGNDASTRGGGASLLVLASDDPNGNGNTEPADARILFKNNLVAANSAHDAATSLARGGGVYAIVTAAGDKATAVVDQDFLTVASNTTDIGAGGLEWDAVSAPNSVPSSGSTRLSLTNSIVVANEAIGVGGGVLPGPGVTVHVAYDDAFGNTGTNWEAQLGVTPGTTTGVIAVDPRLDASYAAPLCSPTVDQGDPDASASSEPQPNGGVVNLGHVGGLATATRTFPDINGDGFVDGLDVLVLAVSFGATSPDPRFHSRADLDTNGMIDGQDLSFLTPFYAQSCP